MLGASNLDIDLLPPLYETLRRVGHSPHLSVVIYSRGGEVHAARRIALLLHEFTDRLSFIVPHFCESAGTIMALAGREIIAGPLAIFSPIDPHLTATDDSRGGSPPALSAQDIRLFCKMSEDWFGLDPQEAQHRALPLLCDNIFPTTLTAFYRSALEVRDMGNELLALHMAQDRQPLRARIIDTLLFGFHSHTPALTREDMARIGLPIVRNAAAEDAGWDITCALRASMGPEPRQSLEHDWHDALIATRDGCIRRRRRREALTGVWEAVEAA